MRLAQTRDKGCMLVFNAQEAIHLFVQDGAVVHAAAGKLGGLEALDRAFELKGSSYGWIAGAEPPEQGHRCRHARVPAPPRDQPRRAHGQDHPHGRAPPRRASARWRPTTISSRRNRRL
ncbi:MAG: DUF4388 domain-containing protein [Verrucomicrobiota bacterium]